MIVMVGVTRIAGRGTPKIYFAAPREKSVSAIARRPLSSTHSRLESLSRQGVTNHAAITRAVPRSIPPTHGPPRYARALCASRIDGSRIGTQVTEYFRLEPQLRVNQ